MATVKRTRTEVESYESLEQNDTVLTLVRYLLSCQASGRPIDRTKISAVIANQNELQSSSSQATRSRTDISSYLAQADQILRAKYSLRLKEVAKPHFALVSTLDPAFQWLVSKAATPYLSSFHTLIFLVCAIIMLSNDSGVELRRIREHLKANDIELTDAQAQKLRSEKYFSEVSKQRLATQTQQEETAKARDLAFWEIGPRCRLLFTSEQITTLMGTIIWQDCPEGINTLEWASQNDPYRFTHLKNLVNRVWNKSTE